jgi:HK97 family phage major capsid protein
MSDEVKIVEAALQEFKQHWGDKIEQHGLMLRDLAQKSQPGWAGDGPVSRGMGAPARTTVGQAAIDSPQVRELLSGQARTAKVTLPDAAFHVKQTTGDVGSPAAPGDVFSPAARHPDIVANGVRQLRVRDLLPLMTCESNQVSSTVEGSTAGIVPAGQVAEGEEKASSEFVFELKTLPVVTIAHVAKASEQVLADAPALAAFIDGRMRHFVLRAEEDGLINGDGTAGNLSGFALAANHIAYAPTSGDSAIDSIRRAKASLESADFMPSGIVIHPDDWAAIELTKADSSTNLYTLADGSASRFVAQGMMPMLWGLPVVTSVSVAQGRFLIADFAAGCTLWQRQGVTVELGYTSDDFARNLVAIRAENRVALAVHQPAAVRYGDLAI